MGCCRQVVGFDMVDDESKPERRPAKHMQSPAQWDLKHNPAYNYYCFYIYANLYILNKLREARGLNTFALRPHAGAPSGICVLDQLCLQLVGLRLVCLLPGALHGSRAACGP